MYQPTLGRFLSRDPLSATGVDVLTDTGFYGERLAAMLANPWYYGGNWSHAYVYAGNNPILYVDPSGLVCCCCIESISWPKKFPEIKKIQRGGTAIDVAGHEIVIEGEVSYKTCGKNDCVLQWKEKDNLKNPLFPAQKPGIWYDQFRASPRSAVFNGWTSRRKPCPGQEFFDLIDRPFLVVYAGRTDTRVLEFEITVTSGADCVCKCKSITLRGKQTVTIVNGVADWKKTTFTVEKDKKDCSE
jgi:RHS repeat-associated protein